ncbi:MAG TPA: DUF4012 domain-containing protein [Acidimicrobiia bacterium]|nr:DUF4012 domain-containing protein [Acidimicrobiia bacterium]
MDGRWAAAFVIAGFVALALTLAVRRIAYARNFVDRPAARKAHRRPTAYLGGVAVTIAVVAGLIGSGVEARVVGLVVAGGAALCLLGLADDARPLSPALRLFVQAGIATAAALAGARLSISGSGWLDVVVTVVFITAVINACNLLDNIDGLLSGFVVVSASGVGVAAVLGHQPAIAALGAALAGACLGFVAWNWRPATIFQGDAGSLALGFMLSVAVLEVRPIPLPPASIVCVALFVALPLLDTATVALARPRHGRRLFDGGTDHLSHRLVVIGRSRQAAVGILLAVQAAFSTLGVLAARAVIPVLGAAAAAIVIAVALLFSVRRARVYRSAATGFPRAIRWTFALAIVGVVGAAVVVGTTARRVRQNLETARVQVERGLDAARDGEPEAGQVAFAAAGVAFDAAANDLDALWGRAARAVPIVGENLGAVSAVADVGRDLADEAADLAMATAQQDLAVRDGVVPVTAVLALQPRFEEAAVVAERATRRVEAVSPTLLLGPVHDALGDLQQELRRATRDAQRNARAAALVSRLFGVDEPRRYFLAVQNPAELRGTGGFIGSWGILSADDGKMELDQFERISTLNQGGLLPDERTLHAAEDYTSRYERFSVADTWQNINMAPDLPTVGPVIADLLPQSGGPEIDGVIAVDPLGLAALLRLTGPVRVDPWPDPITADNVVDVTLRDAYEVLDTEARVDFLGDVAETVWDEVTRVELGDVTEIADALGEATAQGHLTTWFVEPTEEALAIDVGAAGALAPARSDSLMLVNQNAAGNKTDYYLHRSVDAKVRVEPAARGSRARVAMNLTVQLRNDAPAAGLSTTVIGPYDDRFAPGENRSYVSVYSPLGLTDAVLDGQPGALEAERELGRQVYSTFVSIPSGSTSTLELGLEGEVPLGPGGWYALDLGRQATVRADAVRVRVEVPDGYEIADIAGLDAQSPSTAATEIALDEPTTVWVRVVPAGAAVADIPPTYPETPQGLALDAVAAPLGASVTATARGFLPGTPVSIGLDGTPGLLASADTEGVIRAPVTIPSTRVVAPTTITATGVGADGRPLIVGKGLRVASDLPPVRLPEFLGTWQWLAGVLVGLGLGVAFIMTRTARRAPQVVRSRPRPAEKRRRALAS